MTETKVAVITGASSGIGFALAKALAADGYKVITVSRRTAPIEPLVAQYGAEKVIALPVDISEPANVVSLREKLTELLPDGKIHLLFNNAGQACTNYATDAPHDEVERCFKINFYAPVNITRELASFLINAQGTIVFTGSVAATVPFPITTIYSASKAALHQYAKILHIEMRIYGVRVINAVTGGVRTDIGDRHTLPETSRMNFPEGIAAYEYSMNFFSGFKFMDPDVYAKRLLKDVYSSSDPIFVYRGKLASILSWAVSLSPLWLTEWAVIKKFKLGPLVKHFKNKRNQKPTGVSGASPKQS
ncbi:HCL468Cp [Eremothecium sinecaudum]|uniref:HCL468Cp n=1 Tax=Eremothecium sinecaudum TaxID=45286 RepID=A0A109UY46_9SACH|nr:HCL468Cp [Eremothecium sinecaudum]AMD19683.1 HCL468Cp [Eremothecium sinecaudum]